MGKSMTALLGAFARAYYAERKEAKAFDDWPARRLLGEDYEVISQHLIQGAAFFLPDFHGTDEEALDMIVTEKLAALPIGRAVFAESALKTEVDIGTRQYVILGAGYDTFIYRRCGWARDLNVFLIDREEMHVDRRSRAEKAGLKPRGGYTEISADLSQPGWVERLIGHPAFSVKKRTFVSMLGLSYYLERGTMESLMKALGDALPEGSALAFDYMDIGGSEDMRRQGMLAKAAGELMHEGYDYDSLERMLGRCGFLIYEHMTPEEMDRRFFEAYNRAFEGRKLHSMEGVNCCLAVRKRRK